MYSFGYRNQITNIQGVSTTQEDENGDKKVWDFLYFRWENWVLNL